MQLLQAILTSAHNSLLIATTGRGSFGCAATKPKPSTTTNTGAAQQLGKEWNRVILLEWEVVHSLRPLSCCQHGASASMQVNTSLCSVGW